MASAYQTAWLWVQGHHGNILKLLRGEWVSVLTSIHDYSLIFLLYIHHLNYKNIPFSSSHRVSRSLSHVSEPSSRSPPVMDIKAEPVSPPMAFLSAPPSSSLHSPVESLASSCSSYEGSEREEQRRDTHPSVPTPGQGSGPSEGIRGPSLKRLRTESWVT